MVGILSPWLATSRTKFCYHIKTEIEQYKKIQSYTSDKNDLIVGPKL